MLKLKLMTAALALASLILLIMGSTYFTAAAAIACAAMALPMGGYLMWRYLIPEDHSLIPFVLCVPTAELPFVRAFKELGLWSTPLGTTIEPAKAASLGGFVALTSAIAIVVAVVVPSSPTCDDDDGDSDKG
jgi:lipoprotein